MFNRTEAEEQTYLQEILQRLEDAYQAVNETVAHTSSQLQEQKAYLYENRTGMDAAEKAAVKQSVNMQAISGEAAVAYKKRLLKLMDSPYFGRVDFSDFHENHSEPVYVGIHSFFDENENTNLIHDWRAPVSSLFYDFEPGEASFESPSGLKAGEIIRKRQYQIRDGQMEMMLESDLYIRDEVLQKELSHSADNKMKNIVATIQRDQNKIIRNETSPVLIIQGVAGSGKTSIALHRTAFLLYRFKESIRSRDIMIISPNKVFSDYISNVLPELGEDSIPETDIDSLAREVLNNKFKFQSFFEQVRLLLEDHDPSYIERIEFKASVDFLRKLTSYVNWLKRERFSADDISIRFKTVPARYIHSRFNAHTDIPLMRRHTAIAKDVINKAKREFKYDLKTDEKKQIRTHVKNMIGTANLKTLYKEFYDWLNRPDMFQYAKRSTYEYSDLFPFAYLKIQMDGVDTYTGVKHLIVDEMQDYTPVQYAVLSRLFSCNKTILGDANQNVNPYSSTTALDIADMYSDSQSMTLTRSYRSTWEITQFTLGISPGVKVDPVERHGEKPDIRKYYTPADEKQAILEMIREFSKSDRSTLGILCKTQKQAKNLHTFIQKQEKDAHLLTPDSASFTSGVLISCAHLAKGLEFDQVIAPHVTRDNYHTEVDRSMLYIACTRAMHRLTLTACGEPSKLINHQ